MAKKLACEFWLVPKGRARRLPQGRHANPPPPEDLTRGTVVWGQLATLLCRYPHPFPRDSVSVCSALGNSFKCFRVNSNHK